MLPITNESIGHIILITSCLTSNYLTSLLSTKWISLEVINTLTARRNTLPPNYNKYGVNARLTNRGIVALHLTEGNRRTRVRGYKEHMSTTQLKRHERFFLRRRRTTNSPQYNHEQRGVLRGRNRCVPTSREPGTGGYNYGRDIRHTYSRNGTVTHRYNTHISHILKCGSGIQENYHRHIRGSVS
jgi:hypothetical protein